MKPIFLLSAFTLCMSACAAPADEELLPLGNSETLASFDQTPTTSRSEEKEAKATRSLRRSGTNTYDQTCGGLARSGALGPLNAQFLARGADASEEGRDKPSMITPPSPAAMPDLQTSVICRVLIDVDSTGAPVDPIAQCTDTSFEAPAIAAIQSARFEPMAFTGLMMPMEYCRND